MRTLQGTITSNKMQRTVVVRVDRLTRHPKYHKQYRISRTFKADCGADIYGVGDAVVIAETRPLSKEKRWKVVSLVSRAAETSDTAGESDEGNAGEAVGDGAAPARA